MRLVHGDRGCRAEKPGPCPVGKGVACRFSFLSFYERESYTCLVVSGRAPWSTGLPKEEPGSRCLAKRSVHVNRGAKDALANRHVRACIHTCMHNHTCDYIEYTQSY